MDIVAGGTGAAPLELADFVGTPLREGLAFVPSTLVGCDLRARVRVAAVAKVTSGFRFARNIAPGADWCNAARGFMFALGCARSKSCRADRCPTGVTTQNPWPQRGLDVADKGERVRRFHAGTVAGLNGIVAASGRDHPCDLRPHHVARRTDDGRIHSLDQVYDFLQPGELLAGTDNDGCRHAREQARADRLRPPGRQLRLVAEGSANGPVPSSRGAKRPGDPATPHRVDLTDRGGGDVPPPYPHARARSSSVSGSGVASLLATALPSVTVPRAPRRQR